MIDQTAPWKALLSHVSEVPPLREMFEADPGRFERFSARGAGLFLDYSKNRITDRTMALLLDLAREADVAGLGPLRVRVRNNEVVGLARTFGDRAPGDLIALINHVGELEVAVVNGSAHERFGINVGDPVDVVVETA